jgi:serine O-acetyltransferase
MEHLTWGAMRELVAQDRAHLQARLAADGLPLPGGLILYPPYLCVRLFRLSQLLASRGHGLLARVVRQLNLLLTGADFDPLSRIDGGLVVLSPAAVSMTGKAGRNLVLGPLTGLGVATSREDVGGGPGRPVLGDDVELGALSGVLGPVRVGHRVRIGPCCGVTRDVGDDMVVEPHPPRFLQPS